MRVDDSDATDATSLARIIGSRSITRQIPLPTLIVLVTAAAAVSATNRSCRWDKDPGTLSPTGGVAPAIVGGLGMVVGNPPFQNLLFLPLCPAHPAPLPSRWLHPV